MVVPHARADDESPDPIRVELDPPHARGYAAIVFLCGEHDLSTSADLGIALDPIRGNLLIDLSECEFIDSTVIAALLEKFEDLRREGHRLELLVLPGKTNIRRVIELVGLDTLVTVHDAMPGGGTPGLGDGAPASA
jgi:anti-anti-sigma factor